MSAKGFSAKARRQAVGQGLAAVACEGLLAPCAHGDQVLGDLLLLVGRDRGIGLDGSKVGPQFGEALLDGRGGSRRVGGRGWAGWAGWLGGAHALPDVILVAHFLGALLDDDIGLGEDAGGQQHGRAEQGKDCFHKLVRCANKTATRRGPCQSHSSAFGATGCA